MTPREQLIEAIALRCPYCGAGIEPNLVYTARYSEYRDLESLECENFKCNAKWTGFGEPKELPHAYGEPAPPIGSTS